MLARTVVGLRRWMTPDTGFGFIVVGALFAVEVLGKQAVSDLHDLLAVSCLTLIGLTVVARHRRRQLAWLAPLGRSGFGALEWLRAMTFQIGLDMRGTPPVKRGVPAIIRYSAMVLAGLAVVLLIASPAMPHGLRDSLAKISYLLYLAVLSVLWFAMTAATLLLIFVPLAMIHDACLAHRKGSREQVRRRELIVASTYFFTIFMVGVLAPVWVAPVICCALYAVHLFGVVLPGKFTVQILWRPNDSIQVRSMPWGQWVACEFGLIALCVVVLTLASCGALFYGNETAKAVQDARSFMPVTSLAGVTLAWLGPGFMTILCAQMFMSRLRDPARPARPMLHVKDHGTDVPRRTIRKHFRDRGWRVTFVTSRRKTSDACVELVSEAPPTDAQNSETHDRWPLRLRPEQLWGDGVMVRINRRAEIQHRRKFFAGLESLIKAAAQRARGGCGYWLSPHFWFVPGMMRDARPDEFEFDFAEDSILNPGVGPSYHRVFGRAVRRHLFEVLRAAQIDLIFIEDGVNFKRLRRVLRAIFEVYDVHGGRRPAEEIDFRGLPGIRVLIHDYQFDDPFRASGYPEPKYELLGRARILHVFRDRGGQDEESESPFDLGRRPAPVGFPLS